MPKVTLYVGGQELARELTQDMDTVSLGYFIHELVAGMPTANLGHLLQDLHKIYDERKEMDGD